jgi:processive 1,2-diacylglycerol beta-glucosyltransferase
MASTRVLVVSSSAGHGHVMAARALSGAMRRRRPQVDVSRLDALERMRSWYSRGYAWLYVKLVDWSPILWRTVYTATDRMPSGLGSLLTRMAGGPFIRAVERWRPHAVLCTHFLPVELLSRRIRRGKLDTRIHVLVTDYDVHRMWYWPHVHRYYAASELVKARLCLRFGVPEEKVLVTGIPVRRQFGQRHDAVAVRAQHGLDPERPVVLFMSGGFAVGPIRQAIRGIWSDRRDVQILAVCGGNERLRRSVARLTRPAGATLHALGFVEKPAELMAVSDIVVAKAGGMTVSESLVMGKPLVISAAIPGQEERNVQAVLEAGAGVWAPTPEEVRWRVGNILSDPAEARRLSKAARAMACPSAAADIVDDVTEELLTPQIARPRFHGAR